MSSHAIKRTLAIVNRTPLKEKGIKKSSAFCTMTKVDPHTNATNKSKISAKTVVLFKMIYHTFL